MLKILKLISKNTILLNAPSFDKEQIKSKWLGNKAATDEQIAEAELRLQIKLPNDYIDFLKITNGFPQTSSTGISFLPVDKIDYLKILDPDLINIWTQNEALQEVGKALTLSILVGGLEEEQMFLLIPPDVHSSQWRYWKFAGWIPGEEEYGSLMDFLKSELTFLKEQTKELSVVKSKFVVDYSLRNAVLSLDWEKVYTLAGNYLTQNKFYPYFKGITDLFSILLLSASKTDRFDEFEKFILNLNLPIELEHFQNLYKEAARQKIMFVKEFQLDLFSVKQNPIGLEHIEVQITEWRKDLLNPKYNADKVDYQLYFLFNYGAAETYIQHYIENLDIVKVNAHLYAAKVYATLNKKAEAKSALRRYYQGAMDFSPFKPFFCPVLLPLLDHDFTESIKG